jgi:hypothetical protein
VGPVNERASQTVGGVDVMVGDGDSQDQEGQEGQDGPTQQCTAPVHARLAPRDVVERPSHHANGGMGLAIPGCVRLFRIVVLLGGVLALLALVHSLDTASIASALEGLTWWPFSLVCLVYGLNLAIDVAAWRCALPRERAAPLGTLLSARCAAEAVAVLSALASVGGRR